MANRWRVAAIWLLGMLVLPPVASEAVAGSLDPAKALAPFVNDDTFAAAFIELNALTNKADDSNLRAILPSIGADEESRGAVVKRVNQFVGALRAAGVDGVYIVAGLGDLHLGGGPLLFFHVEPGGQPEKVVQMFAPVAPLNLKRWLSEIEMRPHGRDAVLVGAPTTLRRYVSLAKSNRGDLLGPLAEQGEDGAAAALVFCPGPDFRRVVRELWPELPGPLAPLRGELADQWLHLEAAVNLPPDAKLRIAMQATDAEAVKTFVKLWRDLPAAARRLPGNEEMRRALQAYVQVALETVDQQQDGTRVTLKFPTDEAQLANLQKMFSKLAEEAMESTSHNARMDQFKQLARAMHNYHDVNKQFPASAAIRSKDGKPLLSWRVAVLPYLNEGELYKQFRLDEPWDSQHNRTLIEKMPEIFADPDPAFKKSAVAGKTTFQVPVGSETVFYRNDGTTIREIIDGTSRTVMIVEVDPSRAVEWTRPQDWEVDMQHPRVGVERSDRDSFVAAWCDGSVQTIPVDVDDTTLRAHLTRAGREVVDRP